MFKKVFFSLIICFLFKNAFAELTAKLRAIDRTTGRSFILNTPINKTVNFSKLSINVKYCYQNPINMEIENYAYIIIKDLKKNENIFKGWMFSSSPSINSLEHPINDIWLLECKKK
ncbi:MAG: hypothetical protein CFH34_01769 [Alphaproteobacteria bacterium MarineAlpha9_Bin4]|nr:hypothetical protein [Pelagibacterales bacterium]PPR24512.1 MAG: hypothetical protein CFH34_01769 [Alphaproteobacteria bacterium MarineAlpha9_Bin4]|tara:strand:- start:800 stop:1147 length:348 start_codon:yes stop_codon:yes gene_type:complete